jgi:ATP-dependent DNA helicase RecG
LAWVREQVVALRAGIIDILVHRLAAVELGLLTTVAAAFPALRLADLAQHEELVAIAHDDSRLILERDPELSSLRGEALRLLLYLFRRDEAVQYSRTG